MDERMSLEPCPFCGCDTNHGVMNDEECVNFAVLCFYKNDIGCGTRGPYRQSIEDAAIAWNTRHLATPAQTVDVEAIPDAKPLPDLMMASYHEAVGWNAYREALLTRAIGDKP